ncbi:MAG: patatin-like phospholipase family protein [Cellvibrionaceae bacterium]
MSLALVLSGGAPNATLMTGALLAMEEKGVKFDVVSTSGAGAVAGLFYVAPKDTCTESALKNSVNMGIADAIYKRFPVNYKVFQKPGPMADWYRMLTSMNPFFNMAYQGVYTNEITRLWTDSMQFMLAACCPTNLTANSKGMCAHVPWIDNAVDFEALADFDGDFYINAYNITDHEMELFHNSELNAEHFKAAMSFPMIYPPYEMNGKQYIEGAAIDALNYKSLVNKHPEIDTIVVFDVLGIDKLIREPRNLYDSWVLSIMTPIVELAKDDTKLFELQHNSGPNKRDLLKIHYEIPEEHIPESLDWSHSNLKRLFDIGYEAGLKFYEEHKDKLCCSSTRMEPPKASVKPKKKGKPKLEVA